MNLDIWQQLCTLLVDEIARLREVVEKGASASGQRLPHPPSDVVEQLRALHAADERVATVIENLVDI